MGKTIKTIIGIAAIAASFIPGIGTLAAAALRVGGLMLTRTARTRGGSARQEGIQRNVASHVAPLPVVYGKAKIGIRPVDVRVDTSSENNKDLYLVAAICHGSRDGSDINDINKIWMNEKLAVDEGAIQAHFSGKLTVTEHLGSTSQNVDSTLNTKFATAWPSTSKGRGVAYIVAKMIWDKDVYPQGIPNITLEVEGNKVYDHRDTTWKYSDNNALCIRDYLLSGIYGAKLNAAEIDESSFDAMANFCDEAVSIPDGEGGSTTQKRFTCNGWIDTSRPVQENIQELLSSCRAQLIYQGGIFRLHIPRAVSAEAFELNPSNIIGDWEWDVGGIAVAANIVRAHFIDPDKNYQPNSAQWPEPGASNAYLTADNSFESPRDIELPYTNNIYMAEQIAQVALNESRQDISCILTATEEALELETGSVVKVNHATPGWTDKLFWVEAMFLLQDGNVKLALREYDSSAYSYSTCSDASSLPDTNLPDPLTVAAPTSLTLLSDATTALTGGAGEIVPRIKVTWTRSTHAYLDYEEVFARKSGAAEYQTIARIDERDTKEVYVAEVSAGETWQIGVQAVNTLGVRSSLVTDTVVVPDPTEIPHVNDPPAAPGSVTLTATTDLIILDRRREVITYRYITRLSLSIVYTKDALFQTFQVRVWNGSENKETKELVDFEGLGAGPYTVITQRSDRHLLDPTWHCEVGVKNDDGQVSASMTSDDAEASYEEIDRFNIDGADRGARGLLPDGEPDPDMSPVDRIGRRERDLFSGDGAPSGHTGAAGSGDTPAVGGPDVEIGEIGDYKRPLGDVVGVGTDGRPEITDPEGTRMIDLVDREVSSGSKINRDAEIDGKNAGDVREGARHGEEFIDGGGEFTGEFGATPAEALGGLGGQRRGRDLFSGEGSPSGHSGVVGSGDVIEVSHQDVMLGSEDDKKPLSKGCSEDTITPTGNLEESVSLITGEETRRLARGRQGGDADNGTAVGFDPSFDSVPMVVILPRCITHEPRNGQWSAGYDNTKPTYLELVPLDLTASGFTMRARLRQKAAQTAQYDEFSAGAGRILVLVGQTREAQLDPSVAVSDQYTVHYKVELEGHSATGFDLDMGIVVAIDTNDGGGWVERATYPYRLYAPGGGSRHQTWAHEAKIITVSGLGLNDDIRIRFKSEDHGIKNAWDIMEITCFNKDINGDVEHGVTYYTATDSYADATPDAEDSVPWEALEVS